MTWAFGIVFSLAIGTSDFFGAYLARRAQAFTVVITFLVFGTAAVIALLFVVDGRFVGSDVGFGAVSGVTAGFALVLLYHGMSVASAAVVSPVTALLTALVPVGWGMSTGDRLSGVAIVGAVVALAGLLLATFSPELGSRALQGLMWGAAAGMCFGIGFTLLGQTSVESGLWAAAAQRVMALAVLASIATARGLPRFLPRTLLRAGVVGGALGGLGVGAFVAGAQRGSLSEIAVTSSVFPVVTVVLAAVFEKHPLRWWQMAGIVSVVTGVTFIGVG